MGKELTEAKCVPCEGDVPRLTEDEIRDRLPLVPGWSPAAHADGVRLEKSYEFDDFVALMGFVNRLAGLAEDEGHHPDFCVHYSKLDVSIWTHAIGGLSQNDFILAAKLDELDR